MAGSFVEQNFKKAKSHAKKGNILAAENLLKTILQSYPGNKRAQQLLKKLNKFHGENQTKKPSREIIAPVMSLYNEGKLKDVIPRLLELIDEYPYSQELWNLIGATFLGLKDNEKAISAFQKVIDLHPDSSQGHNNLGVSLNKQGLSDEALQAFEKALLLDPMYADAHYNKGTVLQKQMSFREACSAYYKAIQFNPNYFSAHNNLGVTLTQQGKEEEAIRVFDSAIAIQPENADVFYNKAIALESTHRLHEAAENYRKALLLNPQHAKSYRNLTALGNYRPDNLHIEQLEGLLLTNNLTMDDRCHLHFATATLHEEIGNIKEAYDNYVTGGALRKKILNYDIKNDVLLFNRIRNKAKDIQNLSQPISKKIFNHTPIFIVGMPRSGTSLVEQIISCHSKVQGAGELPFMGLYGGKLNSGNLAVTHRNILGVREAYLREISHLANNKPYITDKTPQNFLFTGLILKAFPEAKIVHVKREPAATCWSNFKQYFTTDALGYSYDINDTLSYFQLYRDIMLFWEKLYPGKVYNLNYENLVIDQVLETKRLNEYLGLQWEDSLLSPHQNSRSVRTASQLQVRKKIYKGSSESWKKFRPHLGNVFDALLSQSISPT